MIRSARTRPVIPIAVAAAVASALVLPAPSAAAPGTVGESTPNIRFVKNLSYPMSTDIEFGEFTVDGQLRDYAFTGSLNQGIRVIDITDPEQAFIAATIPCKAFPSDIQVRPDLGLLAVSIDPNPTTCGQPGLILFDVADPRSPVKLSYFRHARGGHNISFHPTAPLIYISDGDVIPDDELGQLPILDVSDPRAPKVATTLEAHVHSPHDITFNAAGTRAYAASISHTDILDTTDPRSPRLVASIHDPAINIHHQADPSPDGHWLFITDEITPYTQGLSPVCPGGAVHIYDISSESEPVRAGIFTISDTSQRPICKPHVFRLLPDGKTMVISWHTAGVRVVDVSDPEGLGAQEVGYVIASGMGENAQIAESVSAKWYEGYIYSSDIRRGLDIFEWLG